MNEVNATFDPADLGLTWIRKRIRSGEYLISEHVIRFLMAGLLTVSEIETALMDGRFIREQSPGQPRPGVLIQGFSGHKAVNVMCSRGGPGLLVISLAYLATQPEWPELACSESPKGRHMKNDFPSCFFCNGKTKSIIVGNFDYRLDGKLYVIKNTPAGLCLQCGEKYVTAQTARRINQLIEDGRFVGSEEVRVIAYTAEQAGSPMGSSQ